MGEEVHSFCCGAPERGAEKALPGADAQDLTTPMGGGVTATLLGNASEGRETEMSQVSVCSPSCARASRAHTQMSMNPARWGARGLAEVAVAIALAAALGFVKPFTMPQGGSVSLEMLPLVFVAIRVGVGPALVAGGLYGFVQLVLPGAYIYHPAQVALDYPLAYMAIAAAGLLHVRGWRALAASVALAATGRLVFHFLSGIIFFATYARDLGWNPWLYSLSYNVLYLVPEAAITAVILWPLLKAYDAAFPGGASAGVLEGERSAVAGENHHRPDCCG